MVYSNTGVYGENECGKSGHLSIFTSFKHLMMLLKGTIFRALFLHLIKDTNSTYGHAAQIFKSGHIVSNAFNAKSIFW